jgi:hypothetical protein
MDYVQTPIIDVKDISDREVAGWDSHWNLRSRRQPLNGGIGVRPRSCRRQRGHGPTAICFGVPEIAAAVVVHTLVLGRCFRGRLASTVSSRVSACVLRQAIDELRASGMKAFN